MLVKRHMHLEVELLKWMILFALAAAMVMIAVTSAAGSRLKDTRPPELLPKFIEESAQPMGQIPLAHKLKLKI